MSMLFEELPLCGGYVDWLIVNVAKKIAMRIMVPPRRGEPEFAKEYELQFNQVAAFRIGIDVAQSIEVLGLTRSDRSPFLEALNPHPNAPRGKLSHYSVRFEEGTVDVLAVSFVLSLLRELPSIAVPSLDDGPHG